jgi:DNA-binding CsgD family transcriptional regulator
MARSSVKCRVFHIQGRSGPRADSPEAARAGPSDGPLPAVDEQAAAEVIGAFYAAGLGEATWSAALSRLAALFGGQDATLTRVETPSASWPAHDAPSREQGAAVAPDGALVWVECDPDGLDIEIAISRPPGRAPWDEADLTALRTLGPHLGWALRLERDIAAGSADADRPVPAAPRLLSQRERDCLAWVARGATSKHAARQLNLSSHTVDEHVRSAMAKLGVSKRTEAAALALARGLITI